MLKANIIFQSPIAHRLLVLFLVSSLLPLSVLVFLFWLVILGDPISYILTPLEILKIPLLIITACYICTMLVLSIRQIRQILQPLQKLRTATREVANQKFNTKVSINSSDEFEELAHSFNRMSTRLGKQFNALETMARIDRLILSTLDIDSIVETILVRMVHIVPCDTVSVIISDEKQLEQARLYYRQDSLSTAISMSEVNLNTKDIKLLRNNPDSLLVETSGSTPKFLSPLRNSHLAFLLLPIFVQNKLSATIVLGYYDKPKYTAEDLINARDLAQRVAVALSNAAWEDKLYHQAHHDNLTNLPNRLLFQDRLKHALTRASRDNTLIALLFIDLDRFKCINDSLGHEAGDSLLKEVARRLTRCVRTVDTVSRLGGDEFTIIIPDLHNSDETAVDISTISRKILGAISVPYKLNGQELNFTGSIGVALFPRDADNFLDLIRNADSAMYYAKAKGKNLYQFYSEDLNAEAKSLLVLENQLHHALENNEFTLYYQPRIHLSSGQVIGMEALIRWQHPDKGLVSPLDFISIAEENGLILSIGKWAIQTACAQVKKWHQQGYPHLKVAVNLSAHQFQAEDLTEQVKQALAISKLDGQYLELEITESTLMGDLEQAIETLNKLKAQGVQLAIDDFGTGYSSLNYLKKFPIDTLKIDQSFVQDLSTDKDNAAIVSAIITLAQILELNVVAEGVESEDELNFLKQSNCDEIQGFIYSRPLPKDDFLNFIKTHPKPQQVLTSQR